MSVTDFVNNVLPTAKSVEVLLENKLSDEDKRLYKEWHNRVLVLDDEKTVCERLKDIDRALNRFENGMYGYCEDCEEIISPERLEAIPTSVFCVDCADLHANER